MTLTGKQIVDITWNGLDLLLPEFEQEQYDGIIHDSLSLFGNIISQKTKLPAVTLISTMLLTPSVLDKYPSLYLTSLQDIVSHLSDFLEVSLKHSILFLGHAKSWRHFTDIYFNIEKLNIVFTSRYFQPKDDLFDESFVFVGPSLLNRNENDDLTQTLDQTKKTIYISLGTIHTVDQNFFQKIIDIFADTEYQVVLSLGNMIDPASLGETPHNIIVRKFVPQVSMLKKTDLFISHGGMNSISESMYAEVPMILIPQSQEQMVNSYRVRELGAGEVITRKELEKDKLLELIDEILHSTSYKEALKRIHDSFILAGGAKRAAEAIIEYFNRQ
jgi:MGT family glycosyltransferase